MSLKQQLLDKINSHSAVVGVIGLGYVGLPLALTFAEKDFNVIGFDIDEKKIPILNSGKSYIKHISEDRIKKVVNSKHFLPTFDFSLLTSCDCILICVPTPLNEHNEPDLTYIENSGKEIAKYLREGQLVVLESSTYPGTTEEILLPMFENSGSVISSDKIGARNPEEKISQSPDKPDCRPANPGSIGITKNRVVGNDFFLAFSPEREDPNNPDYSTTTIPKVVGGVTPACNELACALYNKVIVETVPVSSPRTAEATKLLENIYRSINIALVNELKMVFERMDIDIWEVIEAAKTKPFGFQPFYPGPGLGGHCIPIDPFYLTWKAREYDIHTKFIELAGEVNTYQPFYVVDRASEALNKHKKSINGAKVLILGAAYKKNVDDMRESPSLKLIELLREKGAEVDYNDPYVPKLPHTRKYKFEMESIPLTPESIKSYDLILLSTDHDDYDYDFIKQHAKLVIDTRNAFKQNGLTNGKVVKA
ncbi:nucleotide sugar dehydrogenase [Bacteroidota bacterium]